MAEPQGEFAGLLRELRKRARRTQQELADAAGVSLRTVSDLERGAATTPQKETVRLLGDALRVIGPERARFETAARGRPLAVAPLAVAPLAVAPLALAPQAGAPQATPATAMRSMPRDVASFTGRRRELEQLVKSAVTSGGVVSIHAIGGMAGVGKTTFAVHAAHRLVDRFPGGQVFLRLHGHTPGQQPVDPADALASLLLGIGVAPALIPPGLEERSALWRDRAADRPLLLVLDDAAGSEQVRPLLPGGGGSLVLVTSRKHLSALDDATAISLDTLPPDEAAALLVRLAGRPGLRAGDPGVTEIVALCGFLPLAVGMVARQLRSHPAWSAAGRAAELASARDRLGLMETENLSVAAAFDLSYATLTLDQQRLFRRIGLHPGTEIDVYAAAALDGTSISAARRSLEGVYDQYLLTEPAQGRYRPHDLIREHARSLAQRIDSDDERSAATVRLLDYYQRTAAVANARIRGWSFPGRAGAVHAAAGATRTAGAARAAVAHTVGAARPVTVPALADQEQALAWARAERATLLACLDHAVAAGQHDRVIALTGGLGGLLEQDGPWADGVARHTAAIDAARQLGDRLSHANSLIDLAALQRLHGDYPAAVQTLEEALGLYRELGDRPGQAWALHRLGNCLERTGDYPGAVRALEEALGRHRELGDRRGQGNAYHCLANVQNLTGDYPAAVQALEQALGIFHSLGDRLSQAQSLNRLGAVRRFTGDYPAAVRALEEGLGIFRDLGLRVGQASALYGLGSVWRQTGDYPAAVRALEEALGTYRDLGHRHGLAITLNHLGSARRLMGDYRPAARDLDEALAIYRDIGDRGGEVEALNDRGTLHLVSGELALARQCHQQSLTMSREIDGAWDEAHALAGLGRCALAEGDAAQAQSLLRQALKIFQRIGAAEARELPAELAALAAGSPPG
jgi:tetratricopeptide (TPR) repeat protein/transcriptional regulator with XRE-family HTH domain